MGITQKERNKKMDAKLIIKRFYDLAKEVLAEDGIGCDQISIVFNDQVNIEDKLKVVIRNTGSNLVDLAEDEKDKDIRLAYDNGYWYIAGYTKWMSYAELEDSEETDKYVRIGIINRLK